MDAVEELNTVSPKVKPEEIKLARQVIDTFDGPLDLASYNDEYREGLQAIIDAKIAGQEIVAPSLDAPPKVVNLMEALKRASTRSARRRSAPQGRDPKGAGGQAETRLG